MTESPLIIRGLGEMVAAVPQLVGVQPEQSLVVVPTGPGAAPVARIDLPATGGEVQVAADGIGRAYAGRSGPVVLLAYTDRRDVAELGCARVQAALGPACPVAAAVTVHGDRWQRLDRPEHGVVRQGDRDRFAAEALYRNGATPYRSLAEHRASFAPDSLVDTETMSAAQVAARVASASEEGAAGERAWMTLVVGRHVASRTPLSDADAARLLADVQHTPLRDHAWASIDRREARGHAELWKNLLTRSPQGLEAPAASLCAFSHWVAGDGLGARAALERMPPDQPYPMADILWTVLRSGIDPKTMPIPHEIPTQTQTPTPPAAGATGAHHERRTPPHHGDPNPGPAVGR
jgi:hypothetical protein